VGGRDHVSMVLRCYLSVNTLYILSHMVDRECDTTIESFVVHSPNIGHKAGPYCKGRESSVLELSKVMSLMCRFNGDLSSDY
jgi:hypothetical protein